MQCEVSFGPHKFLLVSNIFPGFLDLEKGDRSKAIEENRSIVESKGESNETISSFNFNVAVQLDFENSADLKMLLAYSERCKVESGALFSIYLPTFLLTVTIRACLEC